MQCYSCFTLILLFLQQHLAQEKIDLVTTKRNRNVIEELLKKIDEISEQSFSNASYGAKLEMLQKIEEKLKKSAKSLGPKGDKYVKLIMKGIKAKALLDISNHNSSKAQVESPYKIYKTSNFYEIKKSIKDYHIEKKNLESYDDIDNVDDFNRASDNLVLNRANNSNSIDQNVFFVLNKNLRRNSIYSEGGFETRGRTSNETVSPEIITNIINETISLRNACKASLERICLNIEQMKQLKCHFDDSFVPIEKLCDGFEDCIDRTDEKFCTSQVTERIQNANQVLRQIDDAFQFGCFPNKTKNYVMTNQIIILRSVLQAQQEFVEKYKYFNRSLLPNSETLNGEGTVKKAVNEISFIISSLALALDAEICSQIVRPGKEITARKFNDLLIEDFDKIMDDVQWPAKSCVCTEERCRNTTTCTEACKRICWQKYGLLRWRCPSINDTETVPLSEICDGKFDCYDQSDEKDCIAGTSFAKFEAHKIFNEILNSLSVKVTSKEYAFIRNMLLSLHSTIEDLQKFSMASAPDLEIIRTLRNKCFSMLGLIYTETLAKSSLFYQKSEIYVFLLSLNEKIVSALKRSHTGNKKNIENDGCYCRHGECSMPICSKKCLRTCVAEPWLTRFHCNNSPNKSVPLDDICNGKPNCPTEEDETHCEKEICRRHHLSLLRYSIKKIGKKQEGTSMGELLSSWKIKVSSTLLIAEQSDRPNPKTMRDIIRNILNDLVITYGTLSDYRRDSGYALEEFTNIARYVMKFLKSCNR